MSNTFGGVYQALRDERGFAGAKVGGRLAVALPGEIPSCKQCGEPLEFLIQFPWLRHGGSTFSAALVFICRGSQKSKFPCDTSSPALGANAVVLLPELTPVEPRGVGSYRPFGIKWIASQDPTDDPWAVDLIDTGLALAEKETDAFLNKYGWTKMGGHPLWMQNPQPPPCPACGGATIFAAQFDSALGFDPMGNAVMVNFGRGGVGYLFLGANQCSERGGAFLWQCR